MDGDGPHVLELQNWAEQHPSSTGYKIRFKQLVVADRTYDLHTIQYGYDALSRLVDADYFPGVNIDPTAVFRAYDYSYDLAGNRTQKVVTVAGSPATTDYTYNPANQLTSDGTNTFTYDANGNLTSDGVNTYTWDRANRLLSMGGIDYAYDGLGRRVSQEQSSVVTEYLLDVQPELWTVLAETTSGATTRFLHGPMGIHGHQDNAGDWGWMVQDALGSVRAEADANLGMQAARQFAPYGDPVDMQGSFATPFAFTGEPADNNGLLHLRARYYNPVSGVFSSLDPWEGNVEEPLTLNGYAYVEGSATNLVDPSGLSSCLGGILFDCPPPPTEPGSGMEIVGGPIFEFPGPDPVRDFFCSLQQDQQPSTPPSLFELRLLREQCHRGNLEACNELQHWCNRGIQAACDYLREAYHGECNPWHYERLISAVADLCKGGLITSCTDRALRRLRMQKRQRGQRVRDVILTANDIGEIISNNRNCQAARQQVQDDCFPDKPDREHENQIRNLEKALAFCERRLAERDY